MLHRVFRFPRFRAALVAVAVSILAAPGGAIAAEDVPYWASLTTDDANMRVGPGGSYRIVWVYKREGLPVKVIRKLSGWRMIEDPAGERGWIVSRFLSLERTAMVMGDDNTALRAGPDEDSALLWRIEPGVTGTLGECAGGWCRFAVGEREGFIEEARLWGAGEP